MFNLAARPYRQFYPFYFFAVFFLLFSSCAPVIKSYPVKKPFVYEVNINLKGKFKTDEKKQLTSQLKQQLHDSIQVRQVQKLIGWHKGPRLLYSELVKPAVYDSLNAEKSRGYLHALLNSLGYYRDSINFNSRIKIKGDQYRTTVNFNVDPGKLIRLDSVWYHLGKDTLPQVSGEDTVQKITGNDTLQQISLRSRADALTKKGEPFAKGLIGTELNRLTDIYRNNGFLRFSREDLMALWDTVGLNLLRPTLDPLEQAQQLQELQRRRANPTADLEIRLRPDVDTLHLKQYYIGKVTVYPDLTADTAFYKRTETMVRGNRIISYQNLFKTKTIAENIYLRHDSLYRQRRYLQTLQRFNTLNAWSLITIDPIPRGTTDTVDIVVKLTPARKYQFNATVEGSKNWNGGNDLITQGNLLGIGLSFGLQNRNFARRAYQAGSNARYGIELNASRDLIQTQQFSVGHTFVFPRFLPETNLITDRRKDNFKSIYAFNAGYTDRLNYFNLTTFNTSWGYDFNWRNHLVSVRVPNIEYSFLKRRLGLQKLIDTNASYKYIFNDGLISSALFSYTLTHSRKNMTNLARFNFEGSGLLLGMIPSAFLDSHLYRFVKLDVEYRRSYKIRRTELAFRIFGGAGYELSSQRNRNNLYLPFFREYYAGGANSMRAWGLRKLGPGSSVKPFDRTIAPDRFGDIQLELNGEYRFYLTDINGVKINSALYTDIGNVWFLRPNPDFPNGEFKVGRLWKDLAIGTGTGLRIDFGFFLIRLDYAYKVKDPSPGDIKAQNKWFYNWNLLNGQLQLGVNYPF